MIRKSRKEDLNRITELLHYVEDIHHKLRPDIFILGGIKYNKDELKEKLDKDSSIFVKTIDNNVVAYIFLEIRFGISFNKEIKYLYIDDLCVDKKYQNKGIGQELIEYAKRFAEENNCHQILLNVWENNPAYEFYKKMGFREQRRILELKL